MNKHYDKLLLLLAVCALIAGAAIYFKQSGPKSGGTKAIGDGEYASIAVAAMEAAEIDWASPEGPQQPSGFNYDVFTPYKIYIDPTSGEFTQDVPPEIGTGVKPNVRDAILLSIFREPYRIQLEGFIDEGEGNVLFLFHDVELSKTVRARNGQAVESSDFSVLAAEVKLVQGEDGSRTRIAKATILDQRTDKQIVLTHRELLFNDEITILVGSDRNTDFQAELNQVGDTFTTEYGTYTLLEINLEESAITVEKAATADFEAETIRLILEPEEVEEPTTIEEEIADPSIAPDTAFDLFFQ